MAAVARHSTPKPVLPPELEQRFADIDQRSADVYRVLDAQMLRLDVLFGDSEGRVAAEVIGDTAVHHLRMAARAGDRLTKGEG